MLNHSSMPINTFLCNGPCSSIMQVILGTRTSCAHYWHCTREDGSVGFKTPGVADDFRRLALHTFGIEDDLVDKCREWAQRPRLKPNVTIIQRPPGVTRRMENIDNVVDAVEVGMHYGMA